MLSLTAKFPTIKTTARCFISWSTCRRDFAQNSLRMLRRCAVCNRDKRNCWPAKHTASSADLPSRSRQRCVGMPWYGVQSQQCKALTANKLSDCCFSCCARTSVPCLTSGWLSYMSPTIHVQRTSSILSSLTSADRPAPEHKRSFVARSMWDLEVLWRPQGAQNKHPSTGPKLGPKPYQTLSTDFLRGPAVRLGGTCGSTGAGGSFALGHKMAQVSPWGALGDGTATGSSLSLQSTQA